MISKKKDREEYARYVAKELGFFIDIYPPTKAFHTPIKGPPIPKP